MGTKKVDAKRFKAIKILLESGETIQEVADYMEVSKITVQRIKSSKTLDEYFHNLNAARFMAQKKEEEKKAEPKVEEPKQVTQVVEHRQTIQVQATHYMMEKLSETNELLRLISNKLAYIVEKLQ